MDERTDFEWMGAGVWGNESQPARQVRLVFFSSKTKITSNFLTLHPIIILIVDLNSSERNKKKKGWKDIQTDRRTDGQTERSEIFF